MQKEARPDRINKQDFFSNTDDFTIFKSIYMVTRLL